MSSTAKEYDLMCGDILDWRVEQESILHSSVPPETKEGVKNNPDGAEKPLGVFQLKNSSEDFSRRSRIKSESDEEA